MDMSLSMVCEFVMDREAWCAAAHGVTELDMNEWLNETELNWGPWPEPGQSLEEENKPEQTSW